MNIGQALRPLEWAHFLLFTLAGWFFDRQPGLPELFTGLGCCALLLAHAYGFNNYKDHPGSQSSWWHRWPLILLGGLIFLQAPVPRLAVCFFLLISTFYSGALKLKGLPWLGVILNGAGFALLTLVASANPSRQTFWLFMLAMFWVAATQLIHEEAHARQDKLTGFLTTAMILGARKSRLMALALLIIAAGFTFLLNVLSGFIFIVYIFIFAYLALKLPADQLRRAMKGLGLLWACGAGLLVLRQINFSLMR